jgi:aspartyl protease family protein
MGERFFRPAERRYPGIPGPGGVKITICTETLSAEAGYVGITTSKALPTRVASRTLSRVLAVVATLACLGLALADATAASLRDQISDLASAHGFAVIGLERLGDAPGTPVEGDPQGQLKALLQGFNYVIVGSRTGGIEKVLISSAKRPAAEVVRGAQVKTTRRGNHHIVKAVLIGPSGARRTASLMVDTGASTVVLPKSMSRALGFRDAELRNGWSQTANGRIRTLQGRLHSVQVGQAVVQNVAVNFVDDNGLGGNLLLGMSFLGRFRVTFDDENRRLILINK